jgi:ElaB/YqjD/DUF883 family membrane-anchored ribosome-binding protein
MQSKRENLNNTGSNIKDTAKKIKNEAQKQFGDIQENVYEVANSAGRKVRVALDSATMGIKDAAEVFEGEIQNHPVRSSALALGAGVIIGLLFAGKRGR